MAQISDTVKTWFVGDSTGLVNAAAKANAALDSNMRKEKQAAQEVAKLYSTRASATKNLILDPGGAATQGLNKLVSSMKMSAVTTGIVSAGISMAADAISKYREEAKAAREETNAFNESFRRTYQANIHLSSAQDSGSLMGKLADLRDQQTELKQRNFDLNPHHGSPAEIALHARYLAADPIHGNEWLKIDRDQIKEQLAGNIQLQTARQKDIGGSLTRENKLVTNRLQGSSAQGQIMDLRAARRREMDALKDSTANTPANQKLIADRYSQQIGAVRELVKLEGDRFALAGRLRGIEGSGRTDAQKRVDSAQAVLKEKQTELLASQYNNKEARQALQSEIAQQNIVLTQAKAELAVEQSRTTLAHRVTAIQGTNLSATAKQYSTTMATNAALRDQLAVVVRINGTQAEGLRQQIAGNDESVRQMRLQSGYGKSSSQIQQRLNRQKLSAAHKDRWEKDHPDGLMSIHRDMSGNVVDGVDMITGQRRAPKAGVGLATSGLSTGGLTTSGLTSGGGGPDLFDLRHQSLVKRGLVNARSPQQKLAAARGHNEHGLTTGGLTTGGLSTGGLSGGATPTVLHKPKPVGGMNDQSAGHTAISAVKAMVAAQNISNAYLKQISMDCSTLVAMWN